MSTRYSSALTTEEVDLIESAIERYYYYCREDSEYEEFLQSIQNLEKKIRFHASIKLPKKEEASAFLQQLTATKIKIVCGDPQTIQDRINEMLPEWYIDGDLVWDGKIFWQKMVQYL